MSIRGLGVVDIMNFDHDLIIRPLHLVVSAFSGEVHNSCNAILPRSRVTDRARLDVASHPPESETEVAPVVPAAAVEYGLFQLYLMPEVTTSKR